MAPRSPYIEGSPSLTAASHCCGVISARSPNRPDPALIVRPHPCCMPWDASIKTFFIFEERLADARSGQFPDRPAVPVELASGGLVDDRPDDRVAPSVTGVGPSLRKRRPSPKLLRCCRPKGEANRPRTWQSCFSGGGLRDTLSIASAQSYRRRSSRTPCASRRRFSASRPGTPQTSSHLLVRHVRRPPRCPTRTIGGSRAARTTRSSPATLTGRTPRPSMICNPSMRRSIRRLSSHRRRPRDRRRSRPAPPQRASREEVAGTESSSDRCAAFALPSGRAVPLAGQRRDTRSVNCRWWSLETSLQ
jgi:hypothetical protein